MNQKGLAPILIVLILTALLGGYLVYSDKIGVYQNQAKPIPPQTTQSIPQSSPTPDETVYTESDRSANWETYVNTAHSYKIQYPSDIALQSEAQNNLLEITYALEIVKDIGKPSYKIARVRILKPEIERDLKIFPGSKPITKMSNLTLQDFTEKLWNLNKEEASGNLDREIGDISETSVDGKKAYEFTLTRIYKHSTGGGEVLDEKHLLIFTERNGKIYNMIVPVNNVILNKVISTFKFTD